MHPLVMDVQLDFYRGQVQDFACSLGNLRCNFHSLLSLLSASFLASSESFLQVSVLYFLVVGMLCCTYSASLFWMFLFLF